MLTLQSVDLPQRVLTSDLMDTAHARFSKTPEKSMEPVFHCTGAGRSQAVSAGRGGGDEARGQGPGPPLPGRPGPPDSMAAGAAAAGGREAADRPTAVQPRQ